jgi:hypothetical protein
VSARPRCGALAWLLCGALSACGFSGARTPPSASASASPASVTPTEGTRGEPSLSEVRERCASSELAPAALRRLTRRELENAIRDIFPSIDPAWHGVDLGPDPLSVLSFDNDEGTLLIGEQTEQELLTTAKEVASLVTDAAHLPLNLGCAAANRDEACATELVDRFGPQLYRRPLTTVERAELLDYYRSVSARAGFLLGVKWTLIAMLQSPEFLYRSELGDASGKLNQYELASELSFTYGGSTPSPELLAKAERGELGSPGALSAEAAALFESPRGQDTLMSFFREWTGYERVLGVDKANVGAFPSDIAPLLAEETRRFLSHVVLEGNGNVKDLLTENTTFINLDLSYFYRFGSNISDFTQVSRPAGQGIGLLAQASILAARAHYDFSSPVFRGLFVYSQLLCREPMSRPLGVPAAEDAPLASTTRERFEKLHAQPSCASCHQVFEPFGYGLEHFDAAGVYRENENGNTIDAHASVTLDDGTTLEFDGLEDLAQKLAALPEVTDCVSGLLASYVFGGAGGQPCLAEEARAQLQQGQIGLRDYYLSLASAPSFSARAPATAP